MKTCGECRHYKQEHSAREGGACVAPLPSWVYGLNLHRRVRLVTNEQQASKCELYVRDSDIHDAIQWRSQTLSRKGGNAYQCAFDSPSSNFTDSVPVKLSVRFAIETSDWVATICVDSHGETSAHGDTPQEALDAAAHVAKNLATRQIRVIGEI